MSLKEYKPIVKMGEAFADRVLHELSQHDYLDLIGPILVVVTHPETLLDYREYLYEYGNMVGIHAIMIGGISVKPDRTRSIQRGEFRIEIVRRGG